MELAPPEPRVDLFARMRSDMAASAAAMAEGTANLAAGTIVSLKQGLVAPLRQIDKTIGRQLDVLASRFINLGPAIYQGIAGGLSNAVGAMATALARGQNIFKAFASSIGAALGQMLTNLGKTLIAFGIGGRAIQFFIKNPAGAVVAGIALVTLGAALSAAASRGVSESGFVGGGGAVASASVSQPAGEARGTVTIIFPPGTAYDPSDPRFQDAIMRSIEAAQGRNVQIRVGGA